MEWTEIRVWQRHCADWNVTKDDIRVRMAAIDEEIYPLPALKEKLAPEGTSDSFSEFISSGFEAFSEVLEPIWDEINEIYGTDYKPELK
jgi:ribonuclease Z